jgi:hypothetical protein
MSETILSIGAAFALAGIGCLACAVAYWVYRDGRRG